MSVAKQLFEEREKEPTSLHFAITNESPDFPTICRIISALASRLEFVVTESINKQINKSNKFQFILTRLYIGLLFVLISTINIEIFPSITIILSLVSIYIFELIALNSGKNQDNAVQNWYDKKFISDAEETLNHGHFLVEKTPLSDWEKLELSLHLQRAEQALMQLRALTKKF